MDDLERLIEDAPLEDLHAIAAAPMAAVERLARSLDSHQRLMLHANAGAIAQWARTEVLRRSSLDGGQRLMTEAAMTQQGSSQAPSVVPFGVLGAPIIEEPVLDCGSIRIHNLRKGATLTVFFDRGDGFPPSVSLLVTNTSMTLTRSAELGGDVKTIYAQQTWSSLTSSWSNEVAVQAGVIRRTPAGLNTLCRLTSNALDVQGVPVPGWGEARVGTDLGISTLTQDGWRIFFGDATPDGSSPAGVVKPIFQLRPTPPFVNENGDLDCRILEGLSTPPPVACKSVATFEKQSHTTFESLLVDGLSLDDYFEVPSGAFFFDGRTYVFVTKRVPLVTVPELVTEGNVSGDVMLESFLVSREHDCERFRLEFDGPVDAISIHDVNCASLPCIGDARHLRFINIAPVVVLNDGQIPELPAGNLLLMWGTGIYHVDSKVYFAYAHLVEGEPIPSPDKWHFLVGDPNAVVPQFVSNALPDLSEQLAGLDLAGVDMGTGEISVQWIAPLNRWLLFVYQSKPKRFESLSSCFVAQKPWGPWHEATFVDPSDPITFDVVNGNIVASPLPQRGLPFGLMYGNYIVEPYTTWDPDSQVARVHVVSSFNNPQPTGSDLVPPNAYGTVLLGLDLECGQAETRVTHRPQLQLAIKFA